MSDVIKEMDTQMQKWITELDALYEKKEGINSDIQKLEENIEIVKKSREILE